MAMPHVTEPLDYECYAHAKINSCLAKRFATLHILNDLAYTFGKNNLCAQTLIEFIHIYDLRNADTQLTILRILDNDFLLDFSSENWNFSMRQSIRNINEDFTKTTTSLLLKKSMVTLDNVESHYIIVANIIWKNLLRYEMKIQKIVDENFIDIFALRLDSPLEILLPKLQNATLIGQFTSSMIPLKYYYFYTLFELSRIGQCYVDRRRKTQLYNNIEYLTNPLLISRDDMRVEDLQFLESVGGQTKNAIFQLIFEYLNMNHQQTLDYIVSELQPQIS